MITVHVEIKGLDRLRANFAKAPSLTLMYLARAVRASIAEVDSNVNEGGIMQFKTPRSRRTGMLVARWGLQRRFSDGGLRGETGPTVSYAPYVYNGVRGRAPNKYLDRIAAAAEPNINKHFNDAAERVVQKLAKI